MVITKTRTKTYTVTSVVIGFVHKEVWLVRREHGPFVCFQCSRKFADIDNDKWVGLAFTDKGNKPVCTQCALKMVEQGVTVNDRRSIER